MKFLFATLITLICSSAYAQEYRHPRLAAMAMPYKRGLYYAPPVSQRPIIKQIPRATNLAMTALSFASPVGTGIPPAIRLLHVVKNGPPSPVRWKNILWIASPSLAKIVDSRQNRLTYFRRVQ